MKTISEEYKKELQTLHNRSSRWGSTAHRVGAGRVQEIADTFNLKEVLDYGCGKGVLKNNLKDLKVTEYDPGIVGKDSTPEPREVVACIDVLEHVEPDYIEDVMEDLKRVTLKKGFFLISLIPAVAKLPDGRNAHILLESSDWWTTLISKYFIIDRLDIIEYDKTKRKRFDTSKYPFHSIVVEVSALKES